MGSTKHFQDFAYVLCQRFLNAPSNYDLVNLVILGSGVLELLVTEGRATHNRFPVEPFHYQLEWLAWAEARMDALAIPRSALQSAILRIDYEVILNRKSSFGWLGADYRFHCTGLVASARRQYRAELSHTATWGLGQISPRRSYNVTS